MLDREQREKAIAAAQKLAQLDFATNGAYANAPYTLLVEDMYLKARIRHALQGNEQVVKLELYQPETQVSSCELSRTEAK